MPSNAENRNHYLQQAGKALYGTHPSPGGGRFAELLRELPAGRLAAGVTEQEAAELVFLHARIQDAAGSSSSRHAGQRQAGGFSICGGQIAVAGPIDNQIEGSVGTALRLRMWRGRGAVGRSYLTPARRPKWNRPISTSPGQRLEMVLYAPDPARILAESRAFKTTIRNVQPRHKPALRIPLRMQAVFLADSARFFAVNAGWHASNVQARSAVLPQFSPLVAEQTPS